jgi:GTP cyclohydrolase I
MTVCPCSLSISDQGAHSQRAVVSIRCRFSGFVWLEELIDIAEGPDVAGFRVAPSARTRSM